MAQEKPTCPHCGSRTVVPIVYGYIIDDYPSLDELFPSLLDDSEFPKESNRPSKAKEDVVFGGCDIMPENWHCKTCDTSFIHK